MYQLLPIICAFTTVLPQFPVEVWCIILRLLDPASLLVTVRTVSYFDSIVQGDPILRKSLREAVDQENKNKFQMLIQPNMAVEIIRQDFPRLFGINVQKSIRSKRKLPILSQLKNDSTTKRLNATKISNRTRFNPYRL